MESNLKIFCDASSKSFDATMYHQIIGSLMYMTKKRPDICFDVNTLSQFLTDSRHVHLIAANHILRYLKGTVDYGLKYDANQKINLEGYVDSDWIGSVKSVIFSPFLVYFLQFWFVFQSPSVKCLVYFSVLVSLEILLVIDQF